MSLANKIFQHYKGNYYKVLYEAIHTETQEKVVVYHRINDEQIWVRPYDMFIETITIDNKPVLRFTEVDT